MYESSRSTNRRTSYSPPQKTNLKDDLARVLREEDLTRKLKFVQSLTEESGTDLEHMAAALLFLLEGQRRKSSERPPRTFSPGRNREQEGPRYAGSGVATPRRGQRPNTRGRAATGTMTKYRIEVGRVHGVGPGQIVGAIANESHLNGTDIGGIDIQNHFSTVDLPGDMSEETVRGLGQVRVAGQALRLTKWERGGDRRLQEKSQRFQKKRGGKPTWKKSRKRVAPPTAEGQTPS